MKQPLFVAVGERMHAPEFSEQDEANWKKMWKVNPLRASKVVTAFKRGFGRLEECGITHDKLHAALNLLPPKAKCGVWTAADALWAKRVAQRFFEQAASEGWILLLMGRRVCDSFKKGLEFCSIYHVAGVRVVTLPHPSGLSRYLNEEANRAEVVQILKKVGFE